MQTAKGVTVVPGSAAGRIAVYKRKKYEINENEINDTKSEVERFESALDKAVKAQKQIYEELNRNESDKECAGIFKAHAMILQDEFLRGQIIEMIRTENKSVEYAVETVLNTQAQMFEQMDDSYMKERAADIYDVKQAVLDNLFCEAGFSFEADGPIIVAALDLTPSELMAFKKSQLAGIVTREGSADSHMAILARSMNIPTLIKCMDIDEGWDGKNAVIDGENSYVCIEL